MENGNKFAEHQNPEIPEKQDVPNSGDELNDEKRENEEATVADQIKNDPSEPKAKDTIKNGQGENTEHLITKHASDSDQAPLNTDDENDPDYVTFNSDEDIRGNTPRAPLKKSKKKKTKSADKITMGDLAARVAVRNAPVLPKFCAPSKYDPVKSVLSAFLKEYERCASRNAWTDDIKIHFLGDFLDGIANTWYADYLRNPANATKQWIEVKNDFKERFARTGLVSDTRRLLDTRKQRPRESALAYYYAILELCEEIDPQMTIDGIAHYFRLGLRPSLLEGFHYMCNKASTREELEDSVRALDNLQSDGHRQQSEMVQLINALSEANITRDKPQPPTRTEPSPSRLPNTRTPDGRVMCWNCNQQGHYARSCRAPVNYRRGRGSYENRGGYNYPQRQPFQYGRQNFSNFNNYNRFNRNDNRGRGYNNFNGRGFNNNRFGYNNRTVRFNTPDREHYGPSRINVPSEDQGDIPPQRNSSPN
jgi:hypothetical protein